jgi:serine/threonine protein kinase
LGLAFLHTNLIVHNDLKPDNILLDENLLPKIGDFGSCTKLRDAQGTQSGEIVGAVGKTMQYAAPEVANVC